MWFIRLLKRQEHPINFLVMRHLQLETISIHDRYTQYKTIQQIHRILLINIDISLHHWKWKYSDSCKYSKFFTGTKYTEISLTLQWVTLQLYTSHTKVFEQSVIHHVHSIFNNKLYARNKCVKVLCFTFLHF